MTDRLTLTKHNSLSRLQSFFVDMRNLSSTYSKNSPLAAKISVIIEYFQLFSLTLLLAVPDNSQKTAQSLFLVDTMVKFSRIFNIESYSESNDNSDYPLGVIYGVWVFTLLKYALQVYVSILARKKRKPQGFSFIIWKWMFMLQARIIFFFTVSFCINAIQTSRERFSQSGSSGYQVIIALSSIAIVFEYIFSMLIILRCTHGLPSKQYFSSKSTVTDGITITLKFMLLMLKIFIPDATSVRSLITVLISTLFCTIRDILFFKTLPPYKLSAIYFKGCVLAGTTSLNLCLLANLFISSISDYIFNYNNTVTMWTVMALIALLLARNYLNSMLTGLNSQFWTHCGAEISMLKLNVMRRMKKNLNLYDTNRCKTNISDIVYRGLGLQENCDLHADLVKDLEYLMIKFPYNEMTKLYVAYFYGIKLRIYVTAMKILTDLERSCSSNIYLDSVLLKARIQEAMQNNVNTSKGNRKLDLWRYLKDVETVQDVKKKMLAQAKLQVELCNELHKQGPDLGKILDYAEKIDVLRKTIVKKSDTVVQNIPEYYIQPLLTYAHYYLTLNYSQLDYIKYTNLYLQRYNKCQTTIVNDSLTQDMLYDKETVFFILEGDGGSDKRIVSCSESAHRVTGWHSQALRGNHISVLLPLIFSSACFDRVKSASKREACDFGSEIFKSFGYHKDRSLLEFVYYIDIYPILDKGFYLSLVLRRVKSNTSYAIVDNNGAIVSMTPKLAENLGLIPEKSAISIDTISNELGRANRACDALVNRTHSKDILTRDTSRPYRKSILLSESVMMRNVSIPRVKDAVSVLLDREDAQRIYNKFSSEGKILTIGPVLNLINGKGMKKERTYCCKLSYKVYEGTYLKMFSFEEMHDDEEEEVSEKEGFLTGKENHRNQVISEEPQKMHFGTETMDNRTFNEEQEGGWIDFGKLDTNRTKIEQLFSPPSSTRKMLTKDISSKRRGSKLYEVDMATDRTDIRNNSPRFPKVILATNTTNTLAQQSSRKVRKQSETITKEVTEDNRNHNILSSKGSKEGCSSIAAHQHGLNRIYSSALDVKYYNPFFTKFTRIFYFILFVVFGIQFGFHVSMTRNLTLLTARKEIVRVAEDINDCLIRIQRDARLIMSLHEGKLDETEMTQYNSSTPILIGKVSDDFETIVISNHELLLEISSLQHGDYKEIYKSKIPVFEIGANGTQENVLMLDRFQALIKIIEVGSTAILISKKNVTQAVPYLQFILANSLNDFLIQGEELSDFFFDVSVREQNERLNTLNVCFGMVFCFMILNIFGSIGVLYRQYKNEKNNLLNFTRLKVSEVESIQEDINRFREFLKEDEANVDSSYVLKLQSKKEKANKVKEDHGVSRTNEALKIIKTRSIRLKYVSYGLKLVISVVLLIALLGDIYHIHKSTIDFSVSKLTQLHFTEKMRARLNIGVTSAFELLALNDTNKIRNEPVSVQYRKIIDEINSILNQIPSRFAENENPIVQNILYNDGCDYFTDPVFYTRCVAARKGAPSISLIMLISGLESTLKSIQDMFYQSNRTAEVLNSIMTNMFPSTVLPNRVVYSLTSLLVTKKNEDFESDVAEAKRQEDIINSMLDVLFAVVSGLVWCWVFRRVRETDNQVKKVMKTIPQEVVLGHFVLKMYLVKTSKGVLEGVKHEI